MTDQPKWTPGPWRYDRTNGSPTTGEHMIAGANPGYLAEVRDCGSGDVRANAHLIAAAPDLYAALEACVVSLERANTEEGVCCCGDSMDRHSDPMHCGHSPVDMGDYYAGQALAAARAALAKARGQA